MAEKRRKHDIVLPTLPHQHFIRDCTVPISSSKSVVKKKSQLFLEARAE